MAICLFYGDHLFAFEESLCFMIVIEESYSIVSLLKSDKSLVLNISLPTLVVDGISSTCSGTFFFPETDA